MKNLQKRKQEKKPTRQFAIHFPEKSLTKQAFKDECNINKIMSRYEKTGLITHIAKGAPQYGDFSNITTYHEAVNQIMLAQDMFESLPAKLRQQFNNDPELFVDFCSNPENLEQLQEMGLAEPPPSPPDEAVKPSEAQKPPETTADIPPDAKKSSE